MQNNNYYMERLRKIRQSKDIKQSTIANKLGIDQPQYSRWESGNTEMSYYTYIQCAEALEVSIDYLSGKTKGAIDYI